MEIRSSLLLDSLFVVSEWNLILLRIIPRFVLRFSLTEYDEQSEVLQGFQIQKNKRNKKTREKIDYTGKEKQREGKKSLHAAAIERDCTWLKSVSSSGVSAE